MTFYPAFESTPLPVAFVSYFRVQDNYNKDFFEGMGCHGLCHNRDVNMFINFAKVKDYISGQTVPFLQN